MAVQGTSGSAGIPEAPVLRSALSGRAVGARRTGEARTGPLGDRAEISSQLAASLRRNNTSLQEFQGGMGEARAALAGLDRLEAGLKALGTNGEAAPGEVARIIRDTVEQTLFEGRRLLAEHLPANPSIAAINGLAPQIEAAREYFTGRLEDVMRSMAGAEVERSNLVAAMQVGTVGSPAEAGVALRAATDGLGPDAAARAHANLNAAGIVRVL